MNGIHHNCHSTTSDYLPINAHQQQNNNNYGDDYNHYAGNSGNGSEYASSTHLIGNCYRSTRLMFNDVDQHQIMRDFNDENENEKRSSAMYEKNSYAQPITPMMTRSHILVSKRSSPPSTATYQHPDLVVQTGNRRFSFVGLDDYQPIISDIMSGKHNSLIGASERHQKAVGSNSTLNKTGRARSPQATPQSDGRATLSRRAQKIAQKAQKLSLASISSELSSSASALYSLFTEGNKESNGIGEQQSCEWNNGTLQLYIMVCGERLGNHIEMRDNWGI